MRYYLHMRSGETFMEDPDGEEFANLDAAKEEAIRSAREIMADRLRVGLPLDGQTFEIHDEDGNLVATVPFKSAIPTG